MKKIRVAFFSANAYSVFNSDYPPVFGGAEVDQYNLSVYLSRNPYIDVTFYVGDFGQTDEPEVIDGVKLQKIPLFGWHEKKFLQKVIFYSHLINNFWKCDADIILTEMAGDLVGWAAIFFKIIRKKHLIHRLASDRDTEYVDAASSGGRRTYYLYRLGLKKADLIFSQTQQQQLLLKERMGFNSQVVANGFFIEKEIDTREKQYILWVGRCTAIKRPELFVELARRVPSERFVMIMPPPIQVEPEGFRRMAAKFVEEAKSLQNMTFIDHVPFNEIQPYFNMAKLFVNTSEYEGFPNTFVQSCLGGTPIASLKVDPDGFITKNQLGIACDNNFEKLVEFVQGLGSHQINFFGAKVLEYGKKNHDISLMGSVYEEALEKLFKLDFIVNNH